MNGSVTAGVVLLVTVSTTLGVRYWAGVTVLHTTFALSESYSTLITSSVCQCKKACLVLPRCMAWTAVKLSNGSHQCLHADRGPQTTTFLPHRDASYGYMLDGLEGVVPASMEADGLFYLVPNLEENITDAAVYCASIPGFRLARFHSSTQFDIGKKMASVTGFKAFDHLMLDLTKNADGQLVWGDGRQLQNEFSSLVVDITEENIYMRAAGISSHSDPVHYFLCQGHDGSGFW